MTFRPVLRREFPGAVRRTGTHRLRVIFAGLAVGTVAIMLLSVRSTALSGPMIFPEEAATLLSVEGNKSDWLPWSRK